MQKKKSRILAKSNSYSKNYSSVSPVCFGKNKLRSNDTTNTPATAFPLKISPTAAGNAAKKFPSV